MPGRSIVIVLGLMGILNWTPGAHALPVSVTATWTSGTGTLTVNALSGADADPYSIAVSETAGVVQVVSDDGPVSITPSAPNASDVQDVQVIIDVTVIGVGTIDLTGVDAAFTQPTIATHTTANSVGFITFHGSPFADDFHETLSGVCHIYGHGGNDVLQGGLGDDAYFFEDGWGTATLIENGGTDAVDLTAVTTDLSLDLAAGTLSSAANSISGVALGVIETVNGGSGNNTVHGPNLLSTWGVEGPDVANIACASGTMAFMAFQNLAGESDNDALLIAMGGSLSGTFNGGGAASNDIPYLTYGTSVSVNDATGAATAIYSGASGGYANVSTFTGGASANSSPGANVTTKWQTDGMDGAFRTPGGFLASFQNLTGGTDSDTFASGSTGMISRTVDGADGTDTLDYGGAIGPLNVNLATGSGSQCGAIANIENVIGTSINDLITGHANNTVFTSNGGVDTLDGGGADDTYALDGTSSVIITDSGGNDTVDSSAPTFAIAFDMDSAPSQIVSSANGMVTATGQFENFVGSPQDDFIHIHPLAVAHTVNAGAASDTLSVDALWAHIDVLPASVELSQYAPIRNVNIETVNTVNTLPTCYFFAM